MIFVVSVILQQIIHYNIPIITDTYYDIIQIFTQALSHLQTPQFQLATIATCVSLRLISDTITLKYKYSNNIENAQHEILKFLNLNISSRFVEVLVRCTLWPSYDKNQKELFSDDIVIYRIKIVENTIKLLNYLAPIIMNNKNHIEFLYNSSIILRLYIIYQNTSINAFKKQIEFASSWLSKIDINYYDKTNKKKFKKIHNFFVKLYKKQKNIKNT